MQEESNTIITENNYVQIEDMWDSSTTITEKVTFQNITSILCICEIPSTLRTICILNCPKIRFEPDETQHGMKIL